MLYIRRFFEFIVNYCRTYVIYIYKTNNEHKLRHCDGNDEVSLYIKHNVKIDPFHPKNKE